MGRAGGEPEPAEVGTGVGLTPRLKGRGSRHSLGQLRGTPRGHPCSALLHEGCGLSLSATWSREQSVSWMVFSVLSLPVLW